LPLFDPREFPKALKGLILVSPENASVPFFPIAFQIVFGVIARAVEASFDRSRLLLQQGTDVAAMVSGALWCNMSTSAMEVRPWLGPSKTRGWN